jgi:perosamine synthetase
MSYLKKKGITTSVHLMPLPLHPLYKKYKKNLKNSLSVWNELVSLPFFPDMKNKEIDYVIKNVKSYFGNK